MSLNLSIMNLGPDLKREHVLERLKLLDAERTNEPSQEVLERKNVIRFSSGEQALEEGDTDDDDDDGNEIRSCSTCEGSVDYLSCSKPANQRKSVKMWREKDDHQIAQAFEWVASKMATPAERSPKVSSTPA